MLNIDFSGNVIVIEKNIEKLDDFVLRFLQVLDECKIQYVLISGYVSILFGRSRMSEDVDIIIKNLDKENFGNAWDKITRIFDDIITDGKEDAYEHMISGHSLRFADKGEFIPNMEVKFPKVDIDRWVLDNRITVKLNGKIIYISKLELQIPFKLFLGSEKDIEDAKHLYNLFGDRLDEEQFSIFLKKLDKKNNFKRFLDENTKD